jgi:hypothetical protein
MSDMQLAHLSEFERQTLHITGEAVKAKTEREQGGGGNG